MPVVTPRRLAGAAAIPALALGLAACSSGSLNPEQVVLASYDDLDAESYTMETTMTINDVDFMEGTSMVDGEASQSSQDVYMSAIMEAAGEDFPDEEFSEDPEAAEMMEAMFADMHVESILVDDVVYLQLSGGMFDTSEEFGEDAWFTADLAEYGDLEQIHEQVGSFDLGSQTETLLNELTDVEETGDGVYTGTLSPDTEIMQEMLSTTDTTGTGGTPQEALDAAEVTVTVDGDGLLEKMEIAFPEIDGMTMHMVSEVVEIGGSYDIAAPESDNLRSFEELTGPVQ